MPFRPLFAMSLLYCTLLFMLVVSQFYLGDIWVRQVARDIVHSYSIPCRSPAFKHRRNFGCSPSSPRDHEYSEIRLRSQATSDQNHCKKNFNSFSPTNLRDKLFEWWRSLPPLVMLLLSRFNRSLFHSLKLMKTKLIHLQSSKKEAQDRNALPSFPRITMSLK